MRIVKLLIFIAILFLANIAWAQTAPSFVLVNQIEENTSYLGQLNRETFEKGDADEDEASAAVHRASLCLKDIEKLSKNETAKNQKFKIKKYKSGTLGFEEIEWSLEEVTSFVGDYYALAKLSELRRTLEQDLLHCLNWTELLSDEESNLDVTRLELAGDDGKKFKARLKTAQSLGLVEKITLNVNNKTYSYKQMLEIAEFTAAAGEKQYNKRREEIIAYAKAKDKPFLDKLTGGKKEIFQNFFAGNAGAWECVGSGGKQLKTPEQLAAASTWYTWSSNIDKIINTWTLTAYIFSGDKYIKTKTKRGIGINPSSGEFQ